MVPMAERLGGLLRQFRIKLRLTQAEIAEQIGASRQQYANWEYGRGNPTGAFLTRLESMGFTQEWSPLDDIPAKLKASRSQLALLVAILSDCSISPEIRANAKTELERALSLSTDQTEKT